jgi:ribosomal protein S18 acetylase RimI-like enzyme
MTINMRKAAPDDKTQIVKLWTTMFPTEKHHNNPNISFDQKIHHDDLFYIAEDDHLIIGTILAGYDGHRGWIYSLAVTPSYQRQGIGTQLINHAIKALEKKGCLKVNLQITGDTSPYIKFYKNLGFKVENRISMGKTLY